VTQAEARAFLESVDFVVPHTDADGLSAGAIALRARDETAEDAVLLGRGLTPFGDDPPLPAGSAAVLDWGIRALTRPGLLVDHHAPEAEPRADQMVVSGYGERPAVSTSGLMRRLVPEAPTWLAAVGAYGDLGDDGLATLGPLTGIKTHVKKLTALVNAPRRAPDGPVATALALLVESESPRAALADPRIAELEASRAEWKEAFDTAKRVGPRVDGGIALISLSSPYQVHPVVATLWERRLRPNVVVAANRNYIEGMVNFAVRGGEGDLRALLRNALPEGTGEFAHGHDRATGGSLSPEQFELLVQRLRARNAA
jgi:single-stranded-DNA-specific exonuclease